MGLDGCSERFFGAFYEFMPAAAVNVDVNPSGYHIHSFGANDRKGSLEKGKDADIVFYDNDIELKFVMRKGQVLRNDL